MAPNNRCLDCIQHTVPYDDPVYKRDSNVDFSRVRGGSSPTNVRDTGQPSGSDGAGDVPVRITTRSRHTYELDRFKKNIMLIFNQTRDARNPLLADDVQRVKRTFEKFQFEVEVLTNLCWDEFKAQCDEIFRRDFSEYGCIALLVFSFGETDRESGTTGIKRALRGVISDSHMLKYLTTNMPASLTSKPKIFITEDYSNKSDIDFMLLTRFKDLLVLKLPLSYRIIEKRNLFQTLCKEVDRLGDKRNFKEIIADSIKSIEHTYTYTGHYISVFNYTSIDTLNQKEIIFMRSR